MEFDEGLMAHIINSKNPNDAHDRLSTQTKDDKFTIDERLNKLVKAVKNPTTN